MSATIMLPLWLAVAAGLFCANPVEERLLRYYANSIEHLVARPPAALR